MKITLKLVSICSLLFFISCARQNDNSNISDITTVHERQNINRTSQSMPGLKERRGSSQMIADQPHSSVNISDNTLNRKITKNANLSISVSDLNIANEKFNDIVNTIPGAYIASSSSSILDNDYKQGNIVIKVPAIKFDELLKTLRQIGKVENESITASDLTKEYFDLNARLKAEESYKTRLEEIMRTRAQTYDNAQDAYSRILQVQERINRIKGQIEYINTITDLSTIRISYYEGKFKSGKKIISAISKIWDGIKDGFHNMFLVLAYIVEYSITLSILFAFVILIIFLIKRYNKWQKLKKEKTNK